MDVRSGQEMERRCPQGDERTEIPRLSRRVCGQSYTIWDPKLTDPNPGAWSTHENLYGRTIITGLTPTTTCIDASDFILVKRIQLISQISPFLKRAGASHCSNASEEERASGVWNSLGKRSKIGEPPHTIGKDFAEITINAAGKLAMKKEGGEEGRRGGRKRRI